MKYSLSLWCYRLIILLLMPVILLLLLLRSISHAEYRQRLLERLGFVSKSFKKHGIIVHAASVGEIIALKPFILGLQKRYTNEPITVTTFTPTGSAQVKAMFGDTVQHCYLPLDNMISCHLFLRALSPKAMVLMETELWPNLIAQCHSRNIKLLLVNGRLSDKSVKSYQRFSYLIKPALRRFNHILCQSQENHRNFLALGADPQRCEVSGNLKFDIAVNDEVIKRQQALSTLLPSDRKIWLIASTHPGDEQIAISAYQTLKQQHDDLLLVIVPRHPERFSAVAQLCIENQLSVIKRSENITVQPSTDIWVLDTLGELLAAYALADVVTIGGSFSEIGGHNPLEPALFSKPIIVGFNMSNFREIMTQMMQVEGILQLAAVKDDNTPTQSHHVTCLSEAVSSLLSNTALAKSLGENAYHVITDNQGASSRSLKQLTQILS